MNKPTKLTGPLAWMAQNNVAANLLMIVLLVGGLVMSGQIKQEVFPEVTVDLVNISVAYPGASPDEVERGVLLSIEDAILGLDGVKRVTSTASEGGAQVSVELLSDADREIVRNDIETPSTEFRTSPKMSSAPSSASPARALRSCPSSSMVRSMKRACAPSEKRSVKSSSPSPRSHSSKSPARDLLKSLSRSHSTSSSSTTSPYRPSPQGRRGQRRAARWWHQD